jgi:DNA-binding GntR family transcriptional regulator
VAETLRDEILAGRVGAGAHLREASLAEALGVSRNTVREAIQILARQGLVTHEMHRGARVTRIDADEIRDIYIVRRLVELAALQRRPDSAALDRLEQAARNLQAAVDSGDDAEIAEADLGFHRVIANLTGSPRLEALYQEVEGETRLSVTIIGNAHPDARQLSREHLELVDLLRKGEITAASKLLDRHLRDAEALLVSRLKKLEPASP